MSDRRPSELRLLFDFEDLTVTTKTPRQDPLCNVEFTLEAAGLLTQTVGCLKRQRPHRPALRIESKQSFDPGVMIRLTGSDGREQNGAERSSVCSVCDLIILVFGPWPRQWKEKMIEKSQVEVLLL